MKKFIFFRFDRLGDFIIITNLIKHIKKRYPNSKITVFCSRFNYNFVKKHNKVDKAILYDRSFSFTKKLLVFRNILKEKYFASFAIDGKSTSNFINFFLKSKFKLGLTYKFFFLGLCFSKPNFFYNKFIFNKYETFTSKSHLKKLSICPLS